MPSVLELRLRDLIAAGAYVVSSHAVERLEQRGMLEWQVIEGMHSAVRVDERPHNQPHPVAEFLLLLPDGRQAKAVWACIETVGIAKLVTVHFT